MKRYMILSEKRAEEGIDNPWVDSIVKIVEALGPILGIVFLYFIILWDGLNPVSAILGLGSLIIGLAAYIIATYLKDGTLDSVKVILIIVFMGFSFLILYVLIDVITPVS